MDDFLYNIPNPMYKYRDWDDPFHKRILTHNEIYLASPNQFNDPYDSALPFRYRKEDMTPDNIFKKLLELGKKFHPGLSVTELHEECYKRQMSGVFDNDRYWKDDYEEHIKEMNQFGILSTTTKNDNLLMWAHYAKCHTGFCIGFDKFTLFEAIPSTLSPVLYEKELPRRPLLEEDPQARFLIRILATKSKDWEYEDEYRIILLNGARKIFKVPPETIKEIIFGFKMSETHKDEIMLIIKEKFPHVKTFQCDINLDEFKMNILPLLKNY